MDLRHALEGEMDVKSRSTSADGKRQLLCDKQADFQQVMKDEKAGRTIA
jgi:hypothetical protein